ncbi:hypothetical protein D0B54_08635 [Solimonas sp. K1W22B-7]|uniref:zinc-dependent metalloprotease family protein n=1 Tax=Solimonas sp. K1W22B-7 TaxID=2303331 RepID=UPI000E32DB11|nr:zinc-dependent metalloprotease family protein [Solimonas sp. K1W22B-7]AXQ28745.1 hypothetical protein D0B54_08635 [Solimonas sp. K1W22B-7]
MKATPALSLLGATALGACLALLAVPAAVTAAPAPLQTLLAKPLLFPLLNLLQPLRGAEAVAALGDNLARLAAWYRMTPQRLADILRTDPSAWLDRNGRLFYVEAAQAGSAAAAPAVQQAPFPLANTFALHSKPGAKRVIYLDFNGHSVSGTAWKAGAINARAYSEDSDYANFSNTELENIQLAWQMVANDYAPFDVDVTTEEPPADAITRSDAADEFYGTRAVVTDNNFGACSGCGGVAYVGTFDQYGSGNSAHAYYQPAWNFNKGSAKVIAETISHEVGHNLGLSHDGTATASYYQGHGSGATGWAPIMGAGYYKEVTHWSRGEYPGANNTEDDVTLIDANGAKFRADDFPAAFAAGYAGLPPLSGNASVGSFVADQAGLIGRASDSDDFAFETAGGSVSFDVVPQTAPNVDLDAVLSLYGEGGNLVASANDPEGLGASIATNLGAGRYFLRVYGTGDSNPSPGYTNYGSLGEYRITGSYPVAGGVDTRPDAFSFAAQANVARSVTLTSGSITVSGIAAPAPVTVSGGGYSINGGAFVTTAGTVANGNTLRVQHVSSGANATSVTTTLNIGGVSGSFVSTTADTVPDAFAFTAVTNAPKGSLQTSGAITVSGLSAPAPVSVGGGSYSINGGAFTTAAGTVANGASLRVQHSASASASSTVTTTLNIGGVSAGFSSTTASDGPCSACTPYSGSLAAGATAYAPASTGFAWSGGTLKGYLRGPAGADFDLALERKGLLGWSSAASSAGNTANENISYNASSGTYRWRIRAYSGSGSYSFWGEPK